ncbi:MAG TPA: hypothetical protein VEF04_15725, partial [Blastocatellia bacterium]|nr:hypothetical protein [Blastocatellia bacterium]
MKKNRLLVNFILMALCFGLFIPLFSETTEAAPRKKRTRAASSRKGQTRARSRTAKRGRSSRRSRRGSRVAAVSRPRTSYYDLPIEDRNLLNAINDAEQAGARIEDSELRAHVKFLSDDLLEGRGPGARGGMLAAKYIAA